MVRISYSLLLLALLAGPAKSIAEDPQPQAAPAQDKKKDEGRMGLPTASGSERSRPLALSPKQLAMWEDGAVSVSGDTSGPAVPRSTLTTKMAFVEKGPEVAIRTDQADGAAAAIRTDQYSGANAVIRTGYLSETDVAPRNVPSGGPELMAGGNRPSPISVASGVQPLPPVITPEPNPAATPMADEKAAPAKAGGSPLPFNIVDAKRETELTIVKGRSQLLRSSVEFTRTAVVDPRVCDLLQYSPTELGFIGKGLGTTEVTVWFRESNEPNVDTQPRSFVVHVVPDLASREPHLKQLEAEIAKLFPNSKVRLRTFGQRIIVLGQARDVSEAAEILNFIRGEEIDTYGRWVSGPGQAERIDAGREEDETARGNTGAAPKGPLPDGKGAVAATADKCVATNKTNGPTASSTCSRSPGVHQVMLRVKIAELDRTAARRVRRQFQRHDPVPQRHAPAAIAA